MRVFLNLFFLTNQLVSVSSCSSLPKVGHRSRSRKNFSRTGTITPSPDSFLISGARNAGSERRGRPGKSCEIMPALFIVS